MRKVHWNMLPPAQAGLRVRLIVARRDRFDPGTNEKLTVRQELTEKTPWRQAGGKGIRKRKYRKKTTRRWFHDTAFIALIILYFPMVPGAGLELRTARTSRDFKSLVSTGFHHPGSDIKWRRVPESNRTRRICNPLHNRFANAPLILKHPQLPMLLIWSGETRLELATPTLARSCSTN